MTTFVSNKPVQQIGFASTTQHDWLKKLASLFHPIRSRTKTNCYSLALLFPRFASAARHYFDWLAGLSASLWLASDNFDFGFYDTQLKSALDSVNYHFLQGGTTAVKLITNPLFWIPLFEWTFIKAYFPDTRTVFPVLWPQYLPNTRFFSLVICK